MSSDFESLSPVPEPLFDTNAKAQQLDRAQIRAAKAGAEHALFLHHEIARDMADRVQAFSQRFEHVAILRHLDFDWVGALSPTIDSPKVILANAPLGLQDFPLAPASQDLVIAPLWLHWVNDLPTMLLALRAALKPGGVLVGAMFGGESLIELKRCLAEAEESLRGGVHPRTSPSVDLRGLASLLQSAGFTYPVADIDRLPLRYANAIKLMKDLSDAGEGNAITSRARTFLPRTLLLKTAELYRDNYSDQNGLLGVSCEVLHFSGSVSEISL